MAILARGPGEVLARETVPTTTPEETLGALERILLGWGGEYDALGIASFGPVDLHPDSPTWGHIVTTAKPGWSGTDVAPRLRERIAVPVAFETDVNGAAIAEMQWGAGRGLRDFA